MLCRSPITLNVKGEYITTQCRRCLPCLQNRRNEWALRLGYEFKHANSGWVFSLTFDNKHVPLISDNHFTYMTLDKKLLQRFIKSFKEFNTRTLLRMKRQYKWSKQRYQMEKLKRVKYYGVGEYGTLYKRPHYHIIIFNLNPRTIQKMNLSTLWPYGGVYIDHLSQEAIAYTAKYLIDDGTTHWETDVRLKPFSIMSKGLGIDYVEHQKKSHKQLKRGYAQMQGVKYRLPRYYKDKIFTKLERQIVGQQLHTSMEAKTNRILEKLTEKFSSRMKAIEAYEMSIDYQVNQIRIKANKSSKF